MSKRRIMTRRPFSKPFAKKSFGQNFLCDRNVVAKIVRAIDPRPDETVVEIGPGRGALTEDLIAGGAQVVAVELDHDLFPVLRNKFGSSQNFRLVEGDALRVDFCELIGAGNRAKLAANLPYNISTAILQHLIGYRECFSEMILMLQKEVVARITAEAGDKERGYLTVLIEAYFESEKLFDVPPNAFRPAPKVMSSIVRLVPKPALEIRDRNALAKVLSIGFRQKRKTILNNLKGAALFGGRPVGDVLGVCGIDPGVRPEDLALDEWVSIANAT
jgi:16S rRNA (adenine1518-N6/adenine1519-N6)-dimethyltransferase